MERSADRGPRSGRERRGPPDYAQRGAPIRLAVFDDRVEVENPGLLPFGLTLEDLPRGISRLRNRVIGRTFHALGLIEQWGSGIQRMIAACRDAGLAPPTFEEIGTRFRVTLWLEQVGAPALDKTEEAILAILRDGARRITSEIAKVIGLTPRATRTRVVRLVERGLVREVGYEPTGPQATVLSIELTSAVGGNLSEICIQISDCDCMGRRSAPLVSNQKLPRIGPDGGHAAVTSQLRTSSRTPSQ